MSSAFLIWLLCGGVFLLIGIYALRAKTAVGFWTVQEPIQVRDVKKYNRAVAKLWIISTLPFVLLGLPLLAGQNSAGVIVPILGGMFWVIMLMVLYIRIEKKYRV